MFQYSRGKCFKTPKPKYVPGGKVLKCPQAKIYPGRQKCFDTPILYTTLILFT